MPTTPVHHALPLRWQLTVIAVAVVTAVFASFGTLLYVDQRTSLLDQTARSLRLSAGAAIADWSHKPPHPAKDARRLPVPASSATGDPKPLADLATRLTTRDTAALTTDATGTVVGDGPALSGATTIRAPQLDPALYRGVATTNQERHFRQETAEGAILIELIPLTASSDASASAAPVGVLQLSTSLQAVDASLTRLRTLLVVGTLAALAATILLTIPLIRRVLRPLRQMAVTSRAITTGDLRRRVAVPPSGDELTDLARAFNEMVDRLGALLATQRRFLADASHELRTPLAALGGGVEMLLLGADRGDAAARARLLRLMEGEIERMGRLVDDLLTLTRLDTQPSGALQLASVDLDALLAEVVATTRLLAPDRQIRLEHDGPPAKSTAVLADADRLRQALLNLTANARAFTPPGGAITVRVRWAATTAVVAIADTGVGIAAADLPRVWDRFYRADPARVRQDGHGGHGLGLAIVRAIIEAHGGRVAITSTPGVGTTVALTLPGTTGDADSPARPHGAEQPVVAHAPASLGHHG